jgi:chlorite dismutase
MSEIANVPRGMREELPKRPAMEEDAYERILREQEKSKEREFVRFSFYQLAPEWRRLPAADRKRQKEEFVRVVGEGGRKFMIYSYSLIGTRGDCDFLLWQATKNFDHFQELPRRVNNTELGAYLTLPYSYFALTRRSIYVNKYEEEYLRKYGGEHVLETARIAINPQGSKYLFVYPFVKTRDWYMLSQEQRQKLMDEHIRVGHEWPDVQAEHDVLVWTGRPGVRRRIRNGLRGTVPRSPDGAAPDGSEQIHAARHPVVYLYGHGHRSLPRRAGLELRHHPA